jgi:uncharacterized protein
MGRSGASRTNPKATPLVRPARLPKRVLDEILRRLLAVSDPERILLFGSAAVGRMTGDSDIDLLVVEQSPGDARARSVALRGALRGLGYPFDILVISAERFAETEAVPGTIAAAASRSGRVIYARS